MALMGISLFAFVPRSLFPEVDLGSVHGVMKVAGGTGIQDAEKLHLQIHEYLKKNKMTVHAISSVGYDEDDITSRLKGVKKTGLLRKPVLSQYQKFFVPSLYPGARSGAFQNRQF